MKLHREVLTPQVLQYDDFHDRGETNYLPYVMYFGRADYRSEVINTDRLGFRFSHGPAGQRASVGGTVPQGPVNLLVGASTVLGIGSTSDATTMPSRLWSAHAPSAPWLNFSGRSYNSAQELTLLALHRHLLPEIEELVVFTGFNNLTLATLPSWQRGEHGAFFFCNEYFDAMDEIRAGSRKPSPRGFLRGGDRGADKGGPARPDEPKRPVAELIDTAVEYTVRHLEGLRRLAGPDTRVTYVLQPMATWLREEPARQEKLLFDELDRISKVGTFEGLYGDIGALSAGRAFADALSAACDKAGLRFFDLNPPLAEAITRDDWLFVDRFHYTDFGADLVSRVLAETIGLS
ncbi:Inducer of phenazine A [Streptomyces sp. UNOC14_S4]|uniref:Inducer of phenazine A n=1 Tax=Streptomyces sp. UNOC14_S4 TaxID=2872340 RepID=UPI001E380745|nr:Inducer of phenazine A [Streptomyces sp. UNOC14_S4]MCC3767829.1 Inducer of phenazine A [Streptomyces sp. UNOC14_S4]